MDQGQQYMCLRIEVQDAALLLGLMTSHLAVVTTTKTLLKVGILSLHESKTSVSKFA